MELTKLEVQLSALDILLHCSYVLGFSIDSSSSAIKRRLPWQKRRWPQPQLSGSQHGLQDKQTAAAEPAPDELDLVVDDVPPRETPEMVNHQSVLFIITFQLATQ